MEEYTEKFFDISMRAGFYEDEEALAAKYRVGLREEMWDELASFSLYTMSEIYQKALQFEKKLKRRSKMHWPTPKFSFSETTSFSKHASRTAIQAKSRAERTTKLTCFKREEAGYLGSTCPM